MIKNNNIDFKPKEQVLLRVRLQQFPLFFYITMNSCFLEAFKTLFNCLKTQVKPSLKLLLRFILNKLAQLKPLCYFCTIHNKSK
jgi:hypothetical protein